MGARKTETMLMTRQMHETTAVFNTHGVVVQRMIDKVMIMTPILIIIMVKMAPIIIIIKTSKGSRGPSLGTVHEM